LLVLLLLLNRTSKVLLLLLRRAQVQHCLYPPAGNDKHTCHSWIHTAHGRWSHPVQLP